MCFYDSDLIPGTPGSARICRKCAICYSAGPPQHTLGDGLTWVLTNSIKRLKYSSGWITRNHNQLYFTIYVLPHRVTVFHNMCKSFYSIGFSSFSIMLCIDLHEYMFQIWLIDQNKSLRSNTETVETHSLSKSKAGWGCILPEMSRQHPF